MSDRVNADFYEAPGVLGEYLLFHFGAPSEVLPYAIGPAAALEYPARCVSDCLETADLPDEARALDLGCAVGRSSFELARHAREVIGIDTSRQFIEAAHRLRETGELPFRYRVEGDLTAATTAKVPAGIDRERVRFQVGDAQALPSDLGCFDIVLMANLIDRLPRPRDLLKALPGLVKANGQLIIASPYTWLEEFTPRAQWLGGFERKGEGVTTFDSLQQSLAPDFDLIRRRNLPFLIREHARKFQWSVAEATVWRRHGSAEKA